MTYTTFAGAGLDVEGQSLPKADAGVSLAAGGDSNSAFLRGYSEQLTGAGIKALADVANKHSITPGAMKDIIAAALQAFRPTPSQPTVDLAQESFVPGTKYAARGQHSLSSHMADAIPSKSERRNHLTEDNISMSANGKEDLASFEKYRENHQRLWKLVRNAGESQWAKHGTTQVKELRRLADSYRSELHLFERVTDGMIQDILDMERVIKETTQSPWKRFLQRITSRSAA
jgi:hypothetical protein